MWPNVARYSAVSSEGKVTNFQWPLSIVTLLWDINTHTVCRGESETRALRAETCMQGQGIYLMPRAFRGFRGLDQAKTWLFCQGQGLSRQLYPHRHQDQHQMFVTRFGKSKVVESMSTKAASAVVENLYSHFTPSCSTAVGPQRHLKDMLAESCFYRQEHKQ